VPSGVIVVHTAENTPDYVAFDGGAEAVARFIQGRGDPGSYHDICDSDSFIQLVTYSCEAFHVRTYNTNWHAYGVSAATRADVWPLAPKAWRDGCVNNMARAARNYAVWLYTLRGVKIPALRLTVAQARAHRPGFISHAELDPARRTDPGAGFPWAQFLRAYAAMTAQPAPVPPPVPPTGGIYVDVKLRILRQGASGGDVKSLQALLREKCGQGIVDDGQFGPATDRAVRNVQRFFRLADDGIVGARTWPCLFL
jgi:hypothetical protein